jgi:hypothetical protein
MKKINLYGHLIVDKIFSNDEYMETLGGIANVWESLLKIDKKLSVSIKPCSIGEAIIVVNTDTNERVGKAILNKKLSTVKVSSADWHHIAYINQIKDTSFINDIKGGIISADITKENPKNCTSHLGFLDFLFISKEDLFDNIIEISKKTKGWVIAHDPTGSIYSNGGKIYEYEIPNDLILSNINILGAGDSFAASFISCFLESDDIDTSIEQAHKKTTFLLKNR